MGKAFEKIKRGLREVIAYACDDCKHSWVRDVREPAAGTSRDGGDKICLHKMQSPRDSVGASPIKESRMAERIIEVLARCWIECDPNRGGASPDEIISDMPNSEFQGQPRWKWFVPRAEAMRDYLNDNGLAIRPKENI